MATATGKAHLVDRGYAWSTLNQPPLGTSGVYAIRHVNSGRAYIGSSVDIRRRLCAHRRELQKGRHHATQLQVVWNADGSDAFVVEILETCAKSELLAREQVYLDAEAELPLNESLMANTATDLGVITKRKAAVQLAGTKQRWSAAAKAQWANPTKRAEMVAGIILAMHDPDIASRRNRGVRASTGRRLETMKQPDRKQQVSESQRTAWQRKPPDARARDVQRFLAVRPSGHHAETRERLSALASARWNDPLKRQSSIDGMKRSAARRNLSGSLKAQWAALTPEQRIARTAAGRAAIEAGRVKAKAQDASSQARTI